MGMEKVHDDLQWLQHQLPDKHAETEVWWSKLFDLLHKKLLPTVCVYIRIDSADPIP